MKQGELVVRKSYGGDMLFRIDAVFDKMAVLRGTDYRLLADSPIDDLQSVRNPDELGGTKRARIQATESLKRMREERANIGLSQLPHFLNTDRRPYFEMPGKVLHLDGDPNYLQKSLAVYHQLRVPAEGAHCHESQMPQVLMRLLPKVRPDIVVVTGHDGVLKQREDWHKLTSYKNSVNFLHSVHVAREYEKHKDSLVVVAGACQSHFEALLGAGANFASSPGRIMIHALDPVYVAVRAAFTPFRETINIEDVIAHTISGMQGVGGIETMGRYRIGVPNLKSLTSNVDVG
ncbi:sporulation peptidase YabG [Cohnella thailandensis]|uniref:Sporulation peptidase YabG n=1 Tax=Cohnella thailandensis TaxID=557557 RepID=A0A841T1J1_9BACL|nr:sporulation peptidase YabG [Cohnella thailandensis]MBB6638273.1 sporulation peptidase YabG [Cohnella thailandensis]MBP1977695.1 spore coat assembly protein [Cohnella thailandensis]